MHNLFSSNKKKLQEFDKKGKEITKTITYRLQFMDSARFMASSLSILLIVLQKEFIKLNVNIDKMIKNVNLVKRKDCVNTALHIQTLKMI